jgi:hypothetical protein
LAASATSGASTGGVGPVTVNNNSGLSTTTILIVAAIATAALLTFGLLYGHK